MLRMIMILQFSLLIFTIPCSASDVRNDKEAKIYKEAQNLIGNFRGSHKKLNQANLLLQKMLEDNPNSSMAYAGLGNLFYSLAYMSGDDFDQDTIKKSHEAIYKAIQLDSNFFDAYFFGALSYIAANNTEKAKEFAAIAKSLNVDQTKSDFLLIKIAAKEKDHDEVIRLGLKLSERKIDLYVHPRIQGLIAASAKKRGNYDLAEKAYLKKIEFEPDSAWALNNYAIFLLYQKHDTDKAIEYGEKALAMMNFGSARKLLSIAYRYKGNSPELKDPELALKYLLQAVELTPDAGTYFEIGLSYKELSVKLNDQTYRNKARDSFEKVLELNPNHKNALIQLKRYKPKVIKPAVIQKPIELEKRTDPSSFSLSFKSIIYDIKGLGIWTMNENGSSKTQLLPWGQNASYSIGMSTIVFQNDYGKGIYSMKLGEVPLKLTSTGFTPAISPDGTKIAFTDASNESQGSERHIWLMNMDGSGVSQITTVKGSFPSWAPDGKKIAFHGEVNTGIWTMDPDGNNLVLLNDEGGYPVWSPDGNKFAYISFSDWHLWVMNSDGTNHSRVSPEKAIKASWSPDGKSLVYETLEGKQIKKISANGSNDQYIDSAGDAHRPNWGRPDSL